MPICLAITTNIFSIGYTAKYQNIYHTKVVLWLATNVDDDIYLYLLCFSFHNKKLHTNAGQRLKN